MLFTLKKGGKIGKYFLLFHAVCGTFFSNISSGSSARLPERKFTLAPHDRRVLCCFDAGRAANAAEHCTQLADRQQQRKTQRVYFARAHNVPGDSCRSPTRLSYLRRAPRKWQERRAFSAPFSLGVCAIFAHIGIILRLFCSLAATIRQTGSGGSERICKPSCCADKRRSGIR